MKRIPSVHAFATPVATLLAAGSAHCGLVTGSGLPTTTLTIDGASVVVEIADEEAERARGLMHRDALAPGRGMVFVYPDAKPRHFWMKDTRIPLSIAFVDDEGRIVRIADMAPLTTRRTASLYPAQYAIEVPKGWFAEHGVDEGDTVQGLDGLRAQ